MAKSKSQYVCAECGGVCPKWQGQCPQCNAWNSLAEAPAEPAAARFAPIAATAEVHTLGEIAATDLPRETTGLAEFDRVLGGGVVPGGVVLIGGDPGIGKSTLLLQALAAMAQRMKVLYVSGEESAAQGALRARRLGVEGGQVRLMAEIALERILGALQAERPQVAVIDSIQTLYSGELQSAPGSVAQVRECAAQLTRAAKRSGVSLVLVGHVTKEGALAGPRVLEHMVDTVLYFEGERGHQFRILRAVKNRFGPADEIGVLKGLHPALKGNGWLAKNFAKARKQSSLTPQPLGLYLALLTYQLDSEECDKLSSHLRLPKTARQIVHDASTLKTKLKTLAYPDLPPSYVYRILHGYSPSAIAAVSLATASPVAQQHMEIYLHKLRYVKSALRGADLLNMGLIPGPQVKEVLAQLHEAKLDGKAVTKQDEAALVREWLAKTT